MKEVVSRPKARAETLLLITATGLLLTSGVVLIGWSTKSAGLMSLGLSGAPMKFTSALCFAVAGIGYISCARRWTNSTWLAGALLLVIGGLTLAEFPLHSWVNIDELFLSQSWTGATLPGRMAPNSAACFVLSGLSLILMSRRRDDQRAAKAIAAIILALGLLGIGANLTGLRPVFSWARFTSMSLPTALCFAAIGLAQMVWCVERAKRQVRHNAWSSSFFLTGIASIVVLGASVYVTMETQKVAFAWVEHTQVVLRALQTFERDLAMAESDTRGFILSHDPQFRTELDTLRDSLRSRLEEIARLTADNSSQQSRIPDLRRTLEDRLAYMYEGMGNVVRPASEMTARTGASRELTRRLRNVIQSMDVAEETLLASRLQANDTSNSQLRGAILFGCGLVLGLFGIALGLTFRAEKLQNEAEDELVLTNQTLESKVEVRTAELKESVEAARQTSERLRAILANTPIVLWTMDKNGVFTLVEGKGAEAIGLESKKLLGTSQPELVRPYSAQSYANSLRALKGETLVAVSPHKDRWFQTSYSPIKNEKDELVEVVGVSIDVTDTKKAEELVIAEESARQASRLKSEFLANMSHEIRTPMNGIIGMNTLLLDTPLSTDQREMVRVIQNSSESLLSIINDILDFSKIEAGKLRVEQEAFDLRKVVDETVALLAPRAHEKGLELICDFDLELPVGMVGDGGRIRQIITNLTGNAIKFTAAGEVTVTTRQVASPPTRTGFRVEVTDSGIGIPEHVQKTLFRPFEQGDSGTTRRFGGTGLGLAISRQLVELMGGQIGFESTAGKGSNFWFQLELPSIALTASDTVPPFLSSAHILIVNGHATNRRILTAQLAKLGFTSEAAETASAAQTLLSRDDSAMPFRLAILDMHSIRSDGVQLAQEIRKNRAHAHLPLIMLASSVADSREAKAVNALVLTKPVRDTQLRRTIAQALSGTRSPLKESGNIPLSTRSIRIILADDNLTNQLVGRMLLEKMGHTVKVVADGLTVIEALRNEPFDLIFMDCQMPALDGYEATRRIRSGDAGAECSRIPIIALTADALATDRDRCIEAGMDDYIAKPLRVEDVARALQHVS